MQHVASFSLIASFRSTADILVCQNHLYFVQVFFCFSFSFRHPFSHPGLDLPPPKLSAGWSGASLLFGALGFRRLPE